MQYFLTSAELAITTDAMAILDSAMELVTVGFAQGTYATDEDGNQVDWSDTAAARFCTIGALRRATTNRFGTPWTQGNAAYLRAVEVVHSLTYNEKGEKIDISPFNDSRTQAEVVALLRRGVVSIVSGGIEAWTVKPLPETEPA